MYHVFAIINASFYCRITHQFLLGSLIRPGGSVGTEHPYKSLLLSAARCQRDNRAVLRVRTHPSLVHRTRGTCSAARPAGSQPSAHTANTVRRLAETRRCSEDAIFPSDSSGRWRSWRHTGSRDRQEDTSCEHHSGCTMTFNINMITTQSRLQRTVLFNWRILLPLIYLCFYSNNLFF